MRDVPAPPPAKCSRTNLVDGRSRLRLPLATSKNKLCDRTDRAAARLFLTCKTSSKQFLFQFN